MANSPGFTWSISMGSACWRRVRDDRRGVVAVMTAASMVPLLISVGVGIDMSRLAMAKAALQAATDEAALAGAASYQAAGQSATAQGVATSYFNRATGLQGALLGNPSASVNAAPGKYSASIQSNNVTVTATATMSTTFLNLASITSLKVTATATAGNPWVQPVISSGFLGSSAGDWNSVYMYAVPLLPTGQPIWNYIPKQNQLYEIASNCSAAFSSSWKTGAQCNAWPGAVVPANQTFPPVTANQPLAFVLFNQTWGQSPHNSGQNANQYGSVSGDMRLIATAAVALGAGPAALDDPSSNLYTSPDYYTGLVFGITSPPNSTRPPDAPSHYSDVNNSPTPNCSLLVQVIDPANPPSLPPLPNGSCYSLSNTAAGLQYANLSCAQMAGRTFVYWFNDMGGNSDDKDYNDLWFSVRCVPSPSSPNSGYLYTAAKSVPNVTVALIQ